MILGDFMRFLSIITILFFFSTLVKSQPDFDVNYMNDYRKTFTFQPIYYPTQNGDSLEILIPFKFSLNYITFEKANDPSLLFSNFLLEFLFRDTNGIIKKTFVHRDTIFFKLLDKDLINTKYYLNFVSTKLPLQNLFLEISIYDKEKTKIKTVKGELKVHKIGNILIFSPIFASKTKEDSRFLLSLLHNALDFTKKDKVIIIPVYSGKGYESLNIQLKSNIEKTHQMNWQKPVSFDAPLLLLSTSPPNFIIDTSNAYFIFEQKAFSGSDEKMNFYLVNFPEKYAYLQNYLIILNLSNSLDTLKLNFRIHWENPPLSLKSINYSLELFYYIITDEKYDFLKSLKKENQWQEFFDAWLEFDTDTTTLFNEAMDEFYKRVDFAFLNFQTVVENDGARSERGKIFILYGKPSSIQRNIDKEGNVVEEWTYYHLKKKFTFISKYKRFELVKINEF